MKKLALSILLFISTVMLIIYAYSAQLAGAIARHVSGYSISFKEISLLKGYMRGIEMQGSDFSIMAHIVTVSDPLSGIVNNTLQEVTIQEPVVHLAALSKDSPDLGFLDKLPRINSLIIEKGSIRLSLGSTPYDLNITSLSLKIRDYIPKKGGKMDIDCSFSLRDKERDVLIGSGVLKGSSIVDTSLSDISMNGSMTLSIEKLETEEISALQAMGEGSFVFKRNVLSMDNLSIALKRLVVRSEGREILIDGIRSVADISLDKKAMLLEVRQIQGDAAIIGNYKGNFTAGLKDNYPFKGRLLLGNVEIKKLFDLLRPMRAGEPYKGWDFSGRGSADMQFECSYRDNAVYLSGLAALRIEEGAFSSQDGLKAGQGINGEVVIELMHPQGLKKNSKIAFKAVSRLSSGEYLWDRFYLNQRDQSIMASAMIEAPFYGQDAYYADIETDLMSTGAYHLILKGSGDGWDLKGEAKDMGLESVHQRILSDSLSSIFPFTKDMTLQGRLNLSFNVGLSKQGYSAQAQINLQDGVVKLPAVNSEIDGIYINTPLYLNEKKTIQQGGEGLLSVRDMKVKGVSIGEIRMHLSADSNSLRLSAPITTNLLDGILSIDKIDSWMSEAGEISLKTSLRLSDAKVAPLTEALGLGSFSGNLNASIHDVELKGRRLYTEGGITADVFGGRIILTNLHGEAPFHSFGADVEFKEIDLDKLTESVNIGKIKGIVQGSLRDLRIEHGQAARFILDIESVKREDIKQTVSTDAVENISILGTGSEGISRLLSTGINQFFKEFPYSKLGIRCILENDVFTIRGKIIEGGKEYLIRKGFLRGIDVVNQNPDNTVSFKDMQGRLTAVFQQMREKSEKNKKED